MVTHIHKSAPKRLYPKEHRKAKGVSAQTMAGRLGIERESVYRLEREWPTRMTPEKQAQWADALGINPDELFHLPGATSLDALAAAVPDDLKGLATEVAADALRRFVAGRR
jgi:transcriptional regulator with XRE-family HTH domain